MKESSLGAKNIAQRNSQSLIIVCGPEKYGSILDFPPGYGWFNHNSSFIRVNELLFLTFHRCHKGYSWEAKRIQRRGAYWEGSFQIENIAASLRLSFGPKGSIASGNGWRSYNRFPEVGFLPSRTSLSSKNIPVFSPSDQEKHEIKRWFPLILINGCRKRGLGEYGIL